jgi:hypothetical protein
MSAAMAQQVQDGTLRKRNGLDLGGNGPAAQTPKPLGKNVNSTAKYATLASDCTAHSAPMMRRHRRAGASPLPVTSQ